MFKKLLTALGVLAVALGAVVIIAGPASAHDHRVDASCGGGVSVNLNNYATETSQPTSNSVTVWVDDQATPLVDHTAFGSSYSSTFAFTAGQSSHSYRVLVHAYDDDSAYGFDTGVLTVDTCSTSITPAAPPSPTDPYCTAAGTVGGGAYTIPADPAGIQYQVWDGSAWVDSAPGTHAAAPGTEVKIQAVAKTGYTVQYGAEFRWTFTLADPDPSACVVPVPPSSSAAGCAAGVTTASYTVPRSPAGYAYYLQGSSTPISSTTEDAIVDVTVFPATVVIVAEANPGYRFPTDVATTWTFDFTAAGDCLIKTDFVKPEATSQSCVVSGGAGANDESVQRPASSRSSAPRPSLSTASLDMRPLSTTTDAAPTAAVLSAATDTLVDAFITIPGTTPHVSYFIDGVLADAGKHILAPGRYTVAAVAATGYFLAGYDGPWTEVLTSAEPCGELITHPLVDPSAQQLQMGCFGDGSYELSNDLADPAALTWNVDGSTVSQGTYSVSAPGTVIVHVAANGPSYGLEADATTDWTFDFVRPTGCDLTTLALTGSRPTGWIALGYALLVSGLALLAVRATRRGQKA